MANSKDNKTKTSKRGKTKTTKTSVSKSKTTKNTSSKPKTVKKVTTSVKNESKTRRAKTIKTIDIDNKQNVDIDITSKIKVEVKKEKSNKLKPIINWVLSKKKLLILIFIIIISIYMYAFFNKDISSVVLSTRYNDIYEWKYDIEDKSIVKFSKKNRTGDLRGTNSRKIDERYYFKAKKPGKTIIHFYYENIYNGSYMGMKDYNVKVDKNLKITITEIHYQ